MKYFPHGVSTDDYCIACHISVCCCILSVQKWQVIRYILVHYMALQRASSNTIIVIDLQKEAIDTILIKCFCSITKCASHTEIDTIIWDSIIACGKWCRKGSRAEIGLQTCGSITIWRKWYRKWYSNTRQHWFMQLSWSWCYNMRQYYKMWQMRRKSVLRYDSVMQYYKWYRNWHNNITISGNITIWSTSHFLMQQI